MQQYWKSAALGGLVGAALSLVVVAGALAFNIVPVASDARLKSYLLTHPKLIVEMQALAEAQEAEESRQDEQKAVDKIGSKKLFDPAVAYVAGPANARNTIVEFYDYNCSHCRNTAAVVKAYFDKHKADTRFAFIEFPIFGEASQLAAQASVAAHSQGDKFPAFHFALMSKGAADGDAVLQAARTAGLDVTKLTADLQSPASQKSMLAGYRLAREAKFGGTPMFIVNGKVHAGEITEAELKALLK